MALAIRRATAEDAAALADIYNWYVLNTIVTFETEAVGPPEMGERIREKLLRYDWLVGEQDGEIVGYAYYGAFRARAAYGHTIESTIYLAPSSTGRGFGRTLYQRLMESAAEQ